jgi:hypothetical protein
MKDIPTPGEVLAPWIEKARETVAATDSLNEAIGTFILEVTKSRQADILATLALIQLAADEDFSGVTR